MRKWTGIVVLVGLVGSAAAAQQSRTIREYAKDGACYFDIDGPGPKNGPAGAVLSVRYENRPGKLPRFRVEYRAERIPKSATADDYYEFDVRREAETGRSDDATGLYGGIYPGGKFVKVIPGEWYVSGDTQRMMALLKSSRYIYLVGDGERYGPFDTGARGRAGQSLEACVAKQR